MHSLVSDRKEEKYGGEERSSQWGASWRKGRSSLSCFALLGGESICNRSRGVVFQGAPGVLQVGWITSRPSRSWDTRSQCLSKAGTMASSQSPEEVGLLPLPIFPPLKEMGLLSVWWMEGQRGEEERGREQSVPKRARFGKAAYAIWPPNFHIPGTLWPVCTAALGRE
jgi:hypothetical protein